MTKKTRLALLPLLLCAAVFAFVTGPVFAQDPNPDDVVKDGATDLGDPSVKTGGTEAPPTSDDVQVGATEKPPAAPPADAPPVPIDMEKIRQQAEGAVPPPANVIDLSALDAAGQVYGQMADLVAKWVATLPGSHDQYGNEITPGYQNARQPDFVPDELKAFIQKHLKEHPELGKQVALSPGEAGSLRQQLADERNGKVVAEMERLAEEARKAEADQKARADAAKPEDPKTDDQSADQPEDVPNIAAPDGDISEGSDDLNPGGQDTADEDIRVAPEDATVANLEEAYGIDIIGEWPERQLRLLATSLERMPKSWSKGIKLKLSTEESGGVAGFYTPANGTATFLPRGQGNLHCYTHEIMHHAGLKAHPQKLQEFMGVLGWVPGSSGKGTFQGDARNFPSDYAKVNPYEHAAEAMAYYLERKEECRSRFTKEVCDYLDKWIAQG